jgi:hypothetical protein
MTIAEVETLPREELPVPVAVANLDAVEGWRAERRGPLVVDAMIRREVVGYRAAHGSLGR